MKVKIIGVATHSPDMNLVEKLLHMVLLALRKQALISSKYFHLASSKNFTIIYNPIIDSVDKKTSMIIK